MKNNIPNKALIDYYVYTLESSEIVKKGLRKRLLSYINRKEYTLQDKIEILSTTCDTIELHRSMADNHFGSGRIYLFDFENMENEILEQYSMFQKPPSINQLTLDILKTIEVQLKPSLQRVFKVLYENAEVDTIIFDDHLFQGIESIENKLQDIKDQHWLFGELLLPKAKMQILDFGPLKIKYFITQKKYDRINPKKQLSIISSYLFHKEIKKVQEEENVTYATVVRCLDKNGFINYSKRKREKKIRLMKEGNNSREIANIMETSPKLIKESSRKLNIPIPNSPSKRKYTQKDYDIMDDSHKDFKYAQDAAKSTGYNERDIMARWKEVGLVTDFSKIDYRTLYIKHKGNKTKMAEELGCGYARITSALSKLENLPKFNLPRTSKKIEMEYRALHKKYDGDNMKAAENSDFDSVKLRLNWKKLGLKLHIDLVKDRVVEAYKEDQTRSYTSLGRQYGCNKRTAKSALVKAGLVKKYSK